MFCLCSSTNLNIAISFSAVKGSSFFTSAALISGLNFGSLVSTAATGAPTATLTASTSQGPTLSFGSKLGGRGEKMVGNNYTGLGESFVLPVVFLNQNLKRVKA